MKSDRLWNHAAVALAAALIIYTIAYRSIEHRRVRNGPWQVTFTNASGQPAIAINEPKLAITNVQIVFPGEALPGTNFSRTLAFDQPHEVPYDIPLGKCIFMDTTFLPGTIVFELFGHEIQLIPRVLTIDKKEIAWRSNAVITLPRTNSSR